MKLKENKIISQINEPCKNLGVYDFNMKTLKLSIDNK